MINPKYGAARADFFRYLLMYREGGVYLDIKSGAKFPFNNIIFPDDEYILCHWELPAQTEILLNQYGEYQQWHIICKPSHPFLGAVIKSVMENIKTYRISDGIGKPGVLKVTGPIVYTEAIMPIVDNYKHRLITNNNIIGLIYNNLSGNLNHENRFAKPHYSKIKEPIIVSINKND
jgi:mannosyltransferase OCH1-like enzyme